MSLLLEVEVRRRGFQFDDRAGDVLLRTEKAEAAVGRLAAFRFLAGGFGLEVVIVGVADVGGIAEKGAKELEQELALVGLLLLLPERRVIGGADPVLHHARLIVGQSRVESGHAAAQQVAIKEWFKGVRHPLLRTDKIPMR